MGHSTFEEVQNFKASNNKWLLFSYDQSAPKVRARGDNDVSEARRMLEANDFNFILMRVQKLNESCFVVLGWVGSGVKPLQKARINSLFIDFIDFCELALDKKLSGSLKDISDDNVISTLSNATIHDKIFGTKMAATNVSSASSPKSPVTEKKTPVMSIGLQLKLVLSIDETNVKEALKLMEGTSEDGIRYIVLEYDQDGILTVTHKGGDTKQKTSPVNEWKNLLKNDSISYVVVKWNLGEELGYGGDTEKCLLVFWTGPNVNRIKIGKANQHRSDVYNMCKKTLQFAGELEVDNLDDINDSSIRNAMLGQRGGKIYTSSTTPRIPASSPASALNALKTPNNTPATPRLSARFGGNTPTTPRVRATAFESDGMKISNEFIAVEACYDLVEKHTQTNWLLFGYSGSSTSTLEMISQGTETSLDALKSSQNIQKHFKPESLLYLVFKHADSYFMIVMKGTNIKGYLKAISTNHAGKLKASIIKIIPVISKTCTISSLTELDDQLLDGVQPASTPRGTIPTRLTGGITLSPASPRMLESSQSTLTNISIVEQSDFNETFGRLISDSFDINAIVLSYVSKNELKLSFSGVIENNIPSQTDPNQIQYFIFKLMLDSSFKIVLVNYIGPASKSIARANATQHRQELYKYLDALMMSKSSSAGLSEYNTSDQTELNEKFLTTKIKGTQSTQPLVMSNLKKRVFNVQSSPSSTSPSISPSSTASPGKSIQITDSHCEKLLSGDGNTNWVLYEYLTPSEISSTQSGTGGLDQLNQRFSNRLVQYALLKLIISETGYGGNVKIILITWAGSDSSSMSKAKSSTHRNLLLEFLQKKISIAGQFFASTLSECNENDIAAKLTGMKGKSNSSPSPSSFNVQSSPSSSSSPSSFGGKDNNLKYDSNVESHLVDMRQGKSEWVQIGYQSDNTVAVIRCGTESTVESFKSYMVPDQIYFFVYRIPNVYKCSLITFVGERVQGFAKARSAGHKIQLYENTRRFISLAGEVNVQNVEHLTDQYILNKITGTRDQQEINSATHSSSSSPSSSSTSKSQSQRFEIQNKTQFSGDCKSIELDGKDELKKCLDQLIKNQDHQQFIDLLKHSNVIIAHIKFNISIENQQYRNLKITDDSNLSAKRYYNPLDSQEWIDQNLLPNQAFFLALAVTTNEGGYGLTTKYLLVQWIGSQLKHIVKSKVAEIRQSVYDFCDSILHLSGEIQSCQQPEHLTTKIVLQKLTGSNVRNNNQMALQKRQSKYEGLGRQHKSQLLITNEGVIRAALENLTRHQNDDENESDKGDKESIDWIMITYHDESMDQMHMSNSGVGDVTSLKDVLKNDQVAFVVIRVMHAFSYLSELGADFEKPYYGLILWKGKSISILEKAMVGHHFNAFSKLVEKQLVRTRAVLQGTHYQPESHDELSVERLKKTMRLFEGDELVV
ncbi:hypothetical protein AKO1_011747 [Acrasis kona]|uniref:ADF-H domain-containing protein n=1 Tax=Acrasis kona TaxID=1008807 RepID=A0AAW2Z855_9EUKA